MELSEGPMDAVASISPSVSVFVINLYSNLIVSKTGAQYLLLYTEQVQSILQPEILTHFAHFRIECKILKFQ